MKKVFIREALALGTALLAFASCTPVTPGPSPTPTPTPTTVKAYSRGTITQKGSIFVNGVEFNDTTASITVNGVAGTDASLRVGMHVEVKGEIDTATNLGTAVSVQANNTMEAPVYSKGASSLVMLGQTVAVNAGTVYEGGMTFGTINPGDVVEIIAYPDGLGGFIATDLEKVLATTWEVEGVITGLAGTTFTLTPYGGQPITVNFSGGLDPAIDNGVLAEVKFSSVSGATINNVLGADILPVASLSPDAGDYMEVEGYVSALAAPTFTVDGVSVNAGTLSLAGIVNGTKVEVMGTFSGGVVTASAIQIK